MLQEKILKELEAIALAKATDYLEVRDGVLGCRDTEALTPEQCSAIASVEKSATGLKVKFYDKLKALELLGKVVGLFDGGAVENEENNLLQAIVDSTKGALHTGDLQEFQQASASGDDLVEPSEA